MLRALDPDNIAGDVQRQHDKARTGWLGFMYRMHRREIAKLRETPWVLPDFNVFEEEPLRPVLKREWLVKQVVRDFRSN